ncbi:hypothetical protein ACK2M7_03985 [Chryseobacterium sp. TY4]
MKENIKVLIYLSVFFYYQYLLLLKKQGMLSVQLKIWTPTDDLWGLALKWTELRLVRLLTVRGLLGLTFLLASIQLMLLNGISNLYTI